ncbi:hypothetical protein ACKWTF_012685 [Chironomus riparius]
MSFFNKIFLPLITLNYLVSANLTANVKTIDQVQETIALQNVLTDIFNVFFVGSESEILIVYFKNELNAKSEVALINSFKNLDESLKFRFYQYEINSDYQPKIKCATLIFIDTIKSFVYFLNDFIIFRDQNKPFKIFVYIESLLHSVLDGIENDYGGIKVASKGGAEHSIFIVNSKNNIYLETIEWFTKQFCNLPEIEVLNKYGKESQKWSQKLTYYEKFLKYYNCELVLALPVSINSQDSSIWSFAEVFKNKKSFLVGGLIPKVFKIAAQKYNFKVEYQPTQNKNSKNSLNDYNLDDIYLVIFNGSYKIPNVVIMQAEMRTFSEASAYRCSKPFWQFNDYFLITPGEPYKAYDILLLPFDTMTWILLGVTFSVALFSIIFINKLSRAVQDVIYGFNVKTPTINLISIFFGISQTRMPDGNFSRQILILFIYFCLIFRTCFQSKMFEFMTSTPRRAPPKTIQDLIDRNYTIYTNDSAYSKKITLNKNEKW